MGPSKYYYQVDVFLSIALRMGCGSTGLPVSPASHTPPVVLIPNSFTRIVRRKISNKTPLEFGLKRSTPEHYTRVLAPISYQNG